MKTKLSLVLLISFLSGALIFQWSKEGVKNIPLYDLEGKMFRLSSIAVEGVRGVVVFSQGNGCPIARKNLAKLELLRREWEPKGIRFVLVNANSQDSPQEIGRELAEFHVGALALKDSSRKLFKALGVERTAHALLLDPSDWAIKYSGALDDQSDYAGSKPEPGRNFLKNAIEDLLSGKPISVPKTEVKGCLVSFS